MTPLENLIAARARIARGWCRFAIAEDIHGMTCDSENPNAIKWCAIGALSPADRTDGFAELLKSLPPKYNSVASFNNAQTSPEPILALFDRAIALADNKGPDDADV